MKKILVALAATALLVLTAFPQSQDPPNPDELKRQIIKRHYSDISDSARWEIKAVYPALQLDGGRLAEEFNKVAKETVMKHVTDFKKIMSEFSENDRKNLPKGVSYSLTIGYTVEYLGDEFVSVYFWRSDYTGGAHPNSWSFVLNYDLEKSRIVELKDLFKPDSGYLDFISKKSIEQIAKKQGEYADRDWIGRGAGAKLKNFANWNATKKGLRFTFDAYQVGSYAEGPYETFIPFESFPQEMQGTAFYYAALASYIGGNPPNNCRGGLYTAQDVEFKVARVKGRKNARAYFYGDDNDCPDGKNCRQKAYVIAGDEVIVARSYGEFSCAWYPPKKGFETVGWIRTNQLAFENQKSVDPRSWAGEWFYAENSIKLIPGKTPGSFFIKGNAFWKGVGDNVHIGELDYSGSPKGDTLRVGAGKDKYDCRVKMWRLGKYLLVTDNKMCGGVNVSFDGVYIRR